LGSGPVTTTKGDVIVTGHRTRQPARSTWATLLALLAALALVAAGCGTDDDPSPGPGAADDDEEFDEGEPVYGGSITMALESETNSWIPGAWAGTQAGVNVAYAIYDPLMAYDGDGELRPYLAESLEPNADLTEWTLTLRSGVQFHDGTPLDAEALKSNFDDHLKQPGAATAGALQDVERMDVVDDLSVTYVLTRSNAAFPDLLTGSIGWPFSPTAAAELGDDAGSNPVGTGPFEFVEWTRDSHLTVRRNENYWQEGLPYLDEITFRPMTDEDTRFITLETGQADATHSVRLSQLVARVRDLDAVRTYEAPGNSGSGAIFNTAVAPVDDVRIRQSLAYALDQQALIDVVAGEGVTTPRTHWYDEDSPWYSERAAEAWPSDDPDRARELLEDYMNDPERSDGRPVGSPVQLEFNCTAIPSLQEQAQVYQAFWQDVGYQVSLNAVEQSAHIQNAITGDYMINCWRQGADSDPYTHLWNAFGPTDEQPLNFTNYEHPELTEQLERLRTEADFEDRYDAVEQIMLLFAEEVPVLWTGGNNEFVAAWPHVRGLTSWEFPDGTPGDGVSGGTVRWGHVWRADD
jgi:peptide/nickel transport system substrate-binding protein